jgi:uncharacterized protein
MKEVARLNRETIDGTMLKKMLTAARQSLLDQQDIINALNVFPVPDGDTGTNMSLTMEAAVREMNKADTDQLDQVIESAANGSLMGARGNSGVILSQLFRGFAKATAGKKTLNAQEIAQAMKNASDTAYKAVMKPTEGTILTVARESAERAVNLSATITDLNVFMEQIIQAANESVARTPELLKVLKDAGVVDSGGKGLVAIMEGAYHALTGKVPDQAVLMQQKPAAVMPRLDPGESLEYGYCTEFMINADSNLIERYQKLIEKHGDSLLVVGNDNLIKVHIHTNHPGKVMEAALELGYLSDIKIDNMRLEHKHQIFGEETATDEIESSDVLKPYGIIAVAMGEGISKIFMDFMVDVVIEGGQTMNPSTEDFLNAIEKIHASHIFIIPNNSNIIMAANQAKALTHKSVTVIPTTTVPQGISAVLAFNQEAEVEDNEIQMIDAMKLVRTGQVTYAVRNTEMNGLTIQKGELIGLADKELLSAGKDVQKVSIELLRKLVSEEDEILTIYYGEEIKEEMAAELEEQAGELFPELEIETYYGGQPLYYYIFSLE